MLALINLKEGGGTSVHKWLRKNFLKKTIWVIIIVWLGSLNTVALKTPSLLPHFDVETI